MKKIFTLLVALTTFAIGMKAEVLLKDSFARNVGDLNAGDYNNMGTDLTNWWYTSSTAAKIQVIDTTLTKAGYQTKPAGKAIQFKGNANKDVRAFSRVSSVAGKSIYYSVLLNVKALKSKSTSKENLITLTDASVTGGYCYAELRFLNNYDDNTYQLGVTKANENGVRWSKPLPLDSTILAVIRYDFIEGDTNDVAYLWINPTKLDESVPTSLHSVQDTASGSGAAWGAKEKVDPSGLKWVYLKPTTNTANIIIDEIRVATKWADLFEGGGTEPAISVPSTLNFGGIFQGETSSKKLTITGSSLKSGITISKTSSEISLSATSFTKSEVEAGAELMVTLNAQTVGAFTDTLVITSDTIVKKVVVGWTTTGVTTCSDIAAMKAAGATQETVIRLTGEAIVTRDTTISSAREIYIEDASGAAKLVGTSVLSTNNMVGQKIKNFVATSNEIAWGVLPFTVQTAPTVVSTGNEIEPQVVTLTELQTNAADYLLEVVQVKKVTFADAGGTFAGNTQYEISQATKTANVKVEMTRGITGYEIPEKANVTGFSLNTSGSVIVPRGIADIVDASEVLLKNGSFEKYKTSSSPFGSATTFEDWDLSGILGTALAVETTDVLEGKAAFKTTKDVTAGYLYQEINLDNYATGDQFDIRICYKNLDTKDSAIVMDSYWSTSMGSTEPMPQTEELMQALPNSQAWDTVMIRTTKPEKAKYFVLKFKFKKKALVLLDNLDFKYYEDTAPYFAVLPEKTSYSFTTNINSDTTVAKLTIRQRNLKESVKLVWSVGTDKTIYSVSKSEVTAAEETVEVKFKSTKAGKFNGTLNIMDDESPETSLMNTTISFAATVIDPSVTPEIVVTPMEFDTFRCKAYEEVTDTFYITSSNCSEYVRCWANEQTGPDSLWGFGISDSYLLANSTDTIILTFAPKKAGKYTARLKVFTAGVDTIFINVVGVAEDGKPAPVVVDWDTAFVWNTTSPYAVLNEGFDMGLTLRNKTLKVTDWQNVVLNGGDRPWWGFNSDTTMQAKMTSYYSDRTDPQEVVTWLVTPALDYKNAPSQVFSFDVMSDLCFEGQTAHLELYYIDPSDPDDIFFQHIEAIDSLIPFGDSELSGNWGTILLPLMGQSFIPDVFFMAFKFTDLSGGNNGATYYVDNVTWGVKEIPQGMEEVHNAQCTMQNVRKFMNNGQLVIVRDGQRYNALGQRVR